MIEVGESDTIRDVCDRVQTALKVPGRAIPRFLDSDVLDTTLALTLLPRGIIDVAVDTPRSGEDEINETPMPINNTENKPIIQFNIATDGADQRNSIVGVRGKITNNRADGNGTKQESKIVACRFM